MIYLIILAIIAFILSLPKVKGIIGETAVSGLLSSLDSEEYKVLNDIMIRKKDGKTTQIDHIIVSDYGIFVIETKNYAGWIFGKENDKYWTQVLNKRTKNKFFNPIFQNKGHINALKELICKDIPYYSIVAFSTKATLKNKMSNVVYMSQLNKAIRQYTDKAISKKEVINICNIIKRANILDKEVKKEHVKMVRSKKV
ncbi:MAG: nuclease-related domain-containing protein [Clostridium sp.]|nr:nuclease-related domain-containing protein [Clostridium sp.]